MKHTPAPWSFYCEEDGYDSWIVQNDGSQDTDRVICRMERNKRVKHDDKRKSDDYRIAAEEVANARLMALAPELLDMLQTLRQAIAERPHQNADEALHVTLSQCDALLGKATA